MNAPSPPPTSSRRAAVYRWFGHPLVGIIGWVSTVLSLVLAIWFFFASQHNPGLTYFVNPGKAAVIRAAQSSDFTVTFRGQILTGDVTAAQVAFWNAGDAPIHGNTVLKPLRIYTQPATAILDVQLRKVSRDVVHADIDKSRFAQGEVIIRWNILEKNDGAVIQLTYVGGEKVDIGADAVIEGQPRLIHETYTEGANPGSYSERLKESAFSRWFGVAILIVIGFLMVVGGISGLREGRGWYSLALLFGALAVWLGFYSALHPPPAPPFGF